MKIDNNKRIFVTSDTHFGHTKDFLWSPRGFLSIEEHDEEVIKRWNSVVGKDDIVIHLGDVMLGDNEHGIKCVEQLNGTILLIHGNHCTDSRKLMLAGLPNVELLGYSNMLQYHKYHFYLSHYPTITGNYDDDKPLKARVINLCGHRHVQDRWADWNNGLIYHVEMDAHNCTPVLLDDIIEEIKEKIKECEEQL